MTMWETPERRALAAAAAAFTKAEITPNVAAWEEAGELPRSLHKKAAAAGLHAGGYPEEVGGDGGDIVDAAVISAATIGAGASTGVIASWLTHSIALPHIIASGNSDLIDRYVRPTLAGQKIGSLAVTEPGGGSDVANIRTKAVRDGDHYIVNGAKTFITSGVRADFVTTAVRTGGAGHRGISLLVIDKSTPGFEVAPPLKKMGWLCSDTAELSFDDVRVPVGNLVGPENRGFAMIMMQFVNERLGIAVQACAAAQRCVDLAAQYARERETFGAPLISRQVIQHKLVDMSRRTAAAWAITRQAYERQVVDANSNEAVIDALFAKRQSVEAVEWVASEAVQIFGGMGYMRETEVERHYRDVRILGIGGGSNEVLNDLAARRLGYTA